MAVVGPGANIEQKEDIKPILEGVSEFQYVTIHNPLTDDFAVKVAQDIPVNMPFQIRQDTSGNTQSVTKDENGARQMYGLNLKNPDFQGRKHISNSTIIPAGRTINLKGNEAQVAVRQLVNEILQREGNRRLIADPVLRNEVENRIIIKIGDVQQLLDGNIQSAREQIDQAIQRSNEEHNGPAFPGLNRQTAISDATGSGDNPGQAETQQKRAPGRPKRAEQSANEV